NNGPEGYNFTKIESDSIVMHVGNSKGTAWADYDLDGDLDVFVANDGSNFLYKNNEIYGDDGNNEHWINIRLTGTKSDTSATGANTSAIGAKVTVSAGGITQLREVSAQTGYSGQNNLNAAFGLSNQASIDTIIVKWPSTFIDTLFNVAVDQFLQIIENKPPAPGNLSAVAVTADSIKLDWIDNSSDEIYFIIERYQGQSINFAPLDSVETDTETKFDDDVETGIRYYYRVKAVNASGGESEYSNIAHATPQHFIKISRNEIAGSADSRGACWGDYDNDDDSDLFVANNGLNFLYENEGDSTFSRVYDGPVDDDGLSWACSWGDYNNDGFLDLFVANADSSNSLYQNINGDNFDRVEIDGAASDSRSVSWVDYDNDGDLDLFVTNHNGNNFLYENEGQEQNFGFTKIQSGDIVETGATFTSCAWGDYDNDGDLDLFVTTDFENNLYGNNGNGDFTRVFDNVVVSETAQSRSASWGDYNNDGFLDLFVANYGEDNFLYRNNGNGTFIAITTGSIVNDSGLSFGSCWGDYDNDGYLDLFVANEYNQASGDTANFLYRNTGNFTNSDSAFTKIIAGIDALNKTENIDSYSASWADYNKDGFLDLFVANGGASVNNYLYTNLRNRKNWLQIKCIGTESNLSGIGARVKLKTTIDPEVGQSPWQIQEISGQTGQGSQNSLIAEFGFGSAASIDSIVVEWPSGIVTDTTWTRNSFLTIYEDISPAIRANFFADVESGTAPLTVTFSDVSQEINAEISQWQWHFGEGDTLYFAEEVEEYIYTEEGSYTVSLIVSGYGLRDTLTRTDYIVVSQFDSTDGGDLGIPNGNRDFVGHSWGDYDNDGFLDIVVVSDDNNFLYHNNGDASFSRVRGNNIDSDFAASQGCSWTDYDNDGYLDLYVANVGNNFLYRNTGNFSDADSTFDRIQDGTIVNDDAESRSSCWGDYDNDGYVDLFVANNGDANSLYHNERDGSFERIVDAGLVEDNADSRSCNWIDYDNDGWL
ncbi:MAG: hypothetical protein GY869_20015, partial [Planctomycetes bacterium]|nr:hypothetical protein [Planctomycetota bacterium]